MCNYEGSRINLTSTEIQKDLGVFVDNELIFRSHILKVVSKANGILGTIRRTFRFLDKDSLLLLYKAMVRPVIEYGFPAWSPLYQKDIDSIEAVQRRATRLVPGFCDFSYEDRLRRLDLPSLTYRRARGDMIYVYKYLHGDVSSHACLFQLSSITFTRGHKFKLLKPRALTFLQLKFFTQRVIEHWNLLPDFVVSAPSLNCFKNRLDVHWSSSPGLYNYKDIV